jgi:hypothetical protein
VIQMVNDEAVTSELGFDARSRNRIVSCEDAEAMKSATGTWFKIERAGSAETSRGAAVRLRSCLPRWYGGEWEASTRRGEIFVRYLGDKAA